MKKNEKKPVKKVKEKPPFVSKYKEIDLNKLLKVEKIPLIIKLSGLRSEYSTIEMSVPMTYTLKKVVSLINERNNGSCKNIRLFIGDESNSLDTLLNKTFLQLGFTKPEPLLLYYKFEPVENPLLLAGFY